MLFAPIDGRARLDRCVPRPMIVRGVGHVFALLGCAALMLTLAAVRVSGDSIDDFVQTEMHHHRIPGLVPAIVRGHGNVQTRAYGQADLESGSATTPDTVFEIGSLTKQFTTAAILLLAEDAKFRLDDRLMDHQGRLPEAWRDVTIRQLLTHTSGIADYTEAPGFNRMRPVSNPPGLLLDLVGNEPLHFPPRTQFEYSNTNYVLLGMLIEGLTGESHGDYLAAHVFRPLGMQSTRVNSKAAIVGRRARGYVRGPGETQNAPHFSPSNAFGAGDLISSLNDLVKWDRALTSRRLLRTESYDAMWSPSAASVASGEPYGFGWDVSSLNGHALVKHAGNITGFSSAIVRFTDDKVTVIVLTNRGDLNAEKVALGIAGRVDPALARQGAPEVADPDPQATRRLRRVFLGMMSGDDEPRRLHGRVGSRARAARPGGRG